MNGEEEGEWSRWQRRRGRKRQGVSRGEDSPHWMGMRYHGPGQAPKTSQPIVFSFHILERE